MLAGLAFVCWGAHNIIGREILGGASIAGIGGTLSAFITKTFLNVHKLSLGQLNRYFRQPVINANIISAQRLADQLNSQDLKEGAYLEIIDSVVRLIRDTDLDPVLEPVAATPLLAATRRRLSPRKKTAAAAPASDPTNDSRA